MTTCALKLSNYSVSFKYQNLDSGVIHEAKRRVLDALAVAFGASDSIPARAVTNIAGDFPVVNGASLIGTQRKTTPDFAAFANGALVRYLDFNDTYLSLEPAHPSDNIAPALSIAETLNTDGISLIGAIVLGYEIQCRLCDAASLRSRGWDHVLYVSISTSLLTSWLLGLPEDKTAHSLALAITPNNTLRQTRVGALSMWKGCAAANAARNGLFASLIASKGITGPAPVFEGEKGLFNLVTGHFSLDTDTFGGIKKPFKILDTYIKYYPTEYHSQAAVEAALALRKRVTLDQTASIDIETYDACVDIIAGDREKWRPETRETADHSLPYCVAAALKHGCMDLEQFSEEKIKDPALWPLMDKISVKRSDAYSRLYPEQFPCKIDIRLKSGVTVSETVLFPKGHPKNRMSDKEVEEKFHKLAGPVLGEKKSKTVINMVWELDKEKSVGNFMKNLHSKYGV